MRRRREEIFFSKTRSRNRAWKVQILYVKPFKTFTFSASGKIFEKSGHQTGTRGRPAPRAEMAFLFLAGNAGHQTWHQKSASTQSRGAPRRLEHTATRGGEGEGGTRLKSSNPTHRGWGTMKNLENFQKFRDRRATCSDTFLSC